MSIRAFTSSDLPAILDLYSRSKLDEFYNEPMIPSLVPLDLDEERFALFRKSVVCVYETDSIRGFGAHAGDQITALFVHPDARGLGIGRALLEHLVGEIRGDCRLSVATSNARAIALYREYGFDVSESFVGLYNGVRIDGVTMHRPAGALSRRVPGWRSRERSE